MVGVSKANCREELLRAAESIAVENGSAHLTLDAVAARAGVSKGGLIYHFPSKDTLLAAMIERMREKSAAAREQAMEDLPEGPLRALEAEILGQMQLHLDNEQINAAMLAVMANSPHLLTDYREDFKARFSRLVSDQANPRRASVLLLATYGLWLLRLLKLSPVDADQHAEVIQEILRELRDEERTPRHATQ